MTNHAAAPAAAPARRKAPLWQRAIMWTVFGTIGCCAVWTAGNVAWSCARAPADCTEARARAQQMLERIQALADAHMTRPGLNAQELGELRGVKVATEIAAARLAANDPDALDGLLQWVGIADPEINEELRDNWSRVSGDLGMLCRR